ncbi:MAG: DUF4430 domain-containing protein [Planctomycetota bacterium]|nr:DUF4430 domain-containing protein [Planctomycetota bacterium]
MEQKSKRLAASRLRPTVSPQRQALPWFPFCLFICLAIGCGGEVINAPPVEEPVSAEPANAVGTVIIEIVDGDNEKTLELSHIEAGTSLEQIMRSITDPAISIRGSGLTAFVDQIGETKTSGSEGWVFRVDGEFATRGVGSTIIDPPATITWSYGGMEPE